MNTYHKIHTIYKRDPENNLKTLLEGQFSIPEFEYLQNNIWDWDEKINGTCIRIILEEEKLIIKGKQKESEIQKSLYTKLETIFQPRLKSMIEVFKNTDICMYGEGFGCFSSNTGILLENGYTETISKIVNNKLKVNVLTYNFKKNILELSPILNYYKYPNTELLRIELEKTRKGGRGRFSQIVCTKNHLLYTDKGYIKAQNIKTNDKIMCLQRDLSFIQEQVLYGILLGDGSIKDKNSISFSHSLKQKDYLDFLEQLFGNIYINKYKYTTGFGSHALRYTMSNKELFNNLINNCSVNNKKRITKKWIEKLTPIAIAFWYMDDGNIDNKHRKNQKANLATQGFDLNELKIIQNILFNKFRIKGHLKKKNKQKEQYSLRFSVDESKIFFLMIAPYIIESLRYKLPQYIKNIPCVFDSIDFNLFLYESKIIKPVIVKQITEVKNKRINKDYIYDIETKNKNYFVGPGFLVHNSKIQKGGGNYRPDQGFILFDIKIGQWWLKHEDVIKIAEKLNLIVVPRIGEGTLHEMIKHVKLGFNSTFGNFIAEGIVARPKVELKARSGERIITKLKYKDFVR